MGPPPFGGGNTRSTPSTSRGCCSFNGATSFRRWKQAKRRDSPIQRASFNGATSFRRWKRGSRGMRRELLITLQWGHLLSAVETATTVPWLAKVPSLQWGHLLSAVETHQGQRQRETLRVASMGPPPFGGGNRLRSCIGIRGRPSFNGATSFRRWKPGPHMLQTGPYEGASMGPPPFGGGNLGLGIWSSEGPCFNGATSFRRWKPRSGYLEQ